MKLLSSKTHPLKGTNEEYWHLATVEDGVHEYMCFLCMKNNKVFIEEITGGQLEFINDDSLALDIAKFLESKGITDILKAHSTIEQYRLKREPKLYVI